jgi:hypothetical protein
MNLIKYLIAYLCLVGMISVIILLWNGKIWNIELTYIHRSMLLFIVFFPLSLIYNKYKPFRLTGNLENIIKEKFINYFNSQKKCNFCNKVVDRKENKCPCCNQNIKDID